MPDAHTFCLACNLQLPRLGRRARARLCADLMALETGVYDRLSAVRSRSAENAELRGVAERQIHGPQRCGTQNCAAPPISKTYTSQPTSGVRDALLLLQPPVTFHVSPGTPAMAAVWVLLAKAKYGANLIESSREHGVRPVVVPFDLAVEFLPVASKQADEALAHLVQGLPRQHRSSPALFTAAMR